MHTYSTVSFSAHSLPPTPQRRTWQSETTTRCPALGLKVANFVEPGIYFHGARLQPIRGRSGREHNSGKPFGQDKHLRRPWCLLAGNPKLTEKDQLQKPRRPVQTTPTTLNIGKTHPKYGPHSRLGMSLAALCRLSRPHHCAQGCG